MLPVDYRPGQPVSGQEGHACIPARDQRRCSPAFRLDRVVCQDTHSQGIRDSGAARARVDEVVDAPAVVLPAPIVDAGRGQGGVCQPEVEQVRRLLVTSGRRRHGHWPSRQPVWRGPRREIPAWVVF
jgi:hypothetical protein